MRARGILRPAKRVRQGSKRKRNHRAEIDRLPVWEYPCCFPCNARENRTGKHTAHD